MTEERDLRRLGLTLLVACFDKAAKVFYPPYQTENPATGVRSFRQEVVTNQQVYDNAEDFELYNVGIWNAKDGEVEPVSPPKLLVTATEIRAQLDKGNVKPFDESD